MLFTVFASSRVLIDVCAKTYDVNQITIFKSNLKLILCSLLDREQVQIEAMASGWNTVESDAGVFTFLVESLGVEGVEFEEILSLDEGSLEQLSYVLGESYAAPLHPVFLSTQR